MPAAAVRPKFARRPLADRVRVGSSKINGRGVFAVVDLPGRRKVGELSGHRVRLPEAWKRVEGRARIYLIELTPLVALDCSRGNSLKHLNHSCAPNCYLRIVRGNVEVYSLRNLAAGVEMTVDYGATPHRGGMVCACGAPVCRGSL